MELVSSPPSTFPRPTLPIPSPSRPLTRPSNRTTRSWPVLRTLVLTLLLSQGRPELRAADNDVSGPSLSITSHHNGQTVNTRTITLSGTATDAGTGDNGISGVFFNGQIPGSTATGGGTVAWSREVTLYGSANTVSVYATDGSDAKNQQRLTLTINFQPLDTLPPTLTVTSHVNGETVNADTITLSGTASDAGQGDNGISSVYINGSIPGATTTGTGTVTWTRVVKLHGRANWIGISAYDDSDVQNAASLTLAINFQPTDPLPPTIVVTSHANGQTVTTSTILLRGTATDAGRGDSGISSVWVRNELPNSNAVGAETAEWSRSVDLRPGPNYLDVYAYDNSDVKNREHQALTINFKPADELAPILSVSSHTEGEVVFASSIVLSGTATDAGRGDNGISSVYLSGTLPDVSALGSSTANWSKTIQLRPGRNWIYMTAYDGSQFPNAASVTLTINYQAEDTLGPTLTIGSHTDGQTVNSRSIILAGTATDAGRGNNGISSVNHNGQIPDSTAVGSETVNWSRAIRLGPGRNEISIVAYDNSPFPNETTQTIVLTGPLADPPSLVVTSHTEGQIVLTNVITLAGTATDAGSGDSGISSVLVNFDRAADDTAVGAGVAHWSRTLRLVPGENTVYLSAADGGEFPEQSNLTLVILYDAGDVSPPVLAIENPERSNQIVTTNTINVSGTATDSGRGGNGIAEVTVNGIAATGGAAAGPASATWSRTIDLVRGANVISVVAFDASANRNSQAGTVTVHYEPADVTPPALEITSHRGNETVTTGSITLLGTASDSGRGGGGISSVTVSGTRANNDTAIGSATASWNRTFDLSLGPNVVSVVARDDSPARNDVALAIMVIYDPADSDPPELEIASHRNGQTVSVPTIVLAGTASDAGHSDNGISGVTVNLQTATGGLADGAATAPWTRTMNLDLGPNLISVVASDNSPRRNSTAFTLTIVYEPVDTTPPELEVTSHQDGQTVLSGSITLAGTASDADRGDNGVLSVEVNGSAAPGGTALGGGKANWGKLISLKLGENVISIVAQDSSPNRNSVAQTIVLRYDPQLASTASEFCWANGGGGTGADTSYGIALDPYGNSYVTGTFEGDATFGPTNLTSRGLSDIFIAKYDPDGTLLWARQAGGVLDDAGFGIAVDTNSNCYVTGYFSDTAEFDGAILETTGTFDLFLAKFGPGGNLLWVTNTTRSAGILGSAVAVDDAGNSYLTGSFVHDAVFGDEVLPNNEFYDAFVAKYDTNGRLLWAHQAGGDGDDRGNGIAVDAPTGQCYLTGSFEGDAFFGSDDIISSAGDADVFISQYDSDGEFQWVRQGGGFGQALGTAIGVDLHGNCLVTGRFDLIAFFGDDLLFSEGFYDLFLAKYDGQGNLLWVRNTEISNAIDGRGVATDAAGSAYITGYFLGPAQFGEQSLTNYALSDVFVSKYDSDGAFIWATQAGGETASSGLAIAVDAAGTCFVTGSMTGVASFGSKILSGGSRTDVFVARLSNGPAATAPQLSILELSIREFQIQFTGDSCNTYRLQVSSDLRQWSTVVTTNSPTGQMTHIESGIPGQGNRFFRVVSP